MGDRIMKKIVVALAGAALGLTACGGGATNEANTTTETIIDENVAMENVIDVTNDTGLDANGANVANAADTAANATDANASNAAAN
jgi:ABC-type glycerol-3-phosphate transport system substrate-binding protein